MMHANRKLSIGILSLGLLLIPQFASAALSDNIVAYWKFDEGTGTSAADATGNGNTASLVGTPTWPAGLINTALGLNGTSQYADIASLNNVINYSAITVSAWIYLNATPTNAPRFVANSHTDVDHKGFQLQLGNATCNNIGQLLEFNFGNGTVMKCAATTITPSNKAWHFIVGTYDGAIVSIYYDAVLIATTTASGAVAIQTSDVNIGRNPTYAGDYVNGNIDEVGIWSRALSASDIYQLYNNGSGFQYPFTVTPSRKLVLFEGYRIKLVSGTLKLYQQ